MAKFSIKRIFSQLIYRDALDKSRWHQILNLYDNGAFKEAYDALCCLMKNPPPWPKKGDMYTLWAELELLANNDDSKALQHLDKAREIGYSEVGYYYGTLGRVMWKRGNLDAAIQYLEKSVKEEPTVANLTDLGQVLSRVNDSRAMSVWQQLIEKDPKDCLAHIYIGIESAEAGDQGKAIMMAKKAERLNPSAEDVFEIGRLYHYAGEVQSSLNSYLEAARRGYNNKGMLYACIASCYFSLREDKLARKYAEWAMQSDPQNDYVKQIWQDVQTIGQDKSSPEDS